VNARVAIIGGTPAGGVEVTLVHVQTVTDGAVECAEYVAVYDVSRVTHQVAGQRVHAQLGDYEAVPLRRLTAQHWLARQS
jgi:hypothetical protein